MLLKLVSYREVLERAHFAPEDRNASRDCEENGAAPGPLPEVRFAHARVHQFIYFVFVLSRFDISVVFVLTHTALGVLSGTDAGTRPSKVCAIHK